MSIVSIHQPNFFPWLGFFAKIRLSDTFVLLDDAEFSKGSYTNRVRISNAGVQRWLTLPIRYKSHTPINEILTASIPWPQQHRAILESCYRKSPHFPDLCSAIFDIYDTAPVGTLAAFNSHAINRIVELLGLNCKIIRSSDCNVKGCRDEKLAALVLKHGGDVYISGNGGKSYQDEQVFADAGINILFNPYCEYHLNTKDQTFIPGLSVLDWLFNFGLEGTQKALEQNR